MKTIAMMTAVGCVAGLLTGCGVPQEEYDAKIGELNTAWTEIESLKEKNADLDSLLTAEKAKTATARTQLADASGRAKVAQQKEAAATKALADEQAKVSALESDLSAAKESIAKAQEEAAKVNGELAKLQEPSTQEAPESPEATSAEKSDAEIALDLLNKMGNQ